MSYTTNSYGGMIRDRARIDAYLGALRKVIEPGVTTVLDVGTGTGIVAFAARQAGARKVWALEPNHAIQTARAIARANNITGIEFIQKLSTDVELPPADVMISDLRGATPFFGRLIPSIVDARQRLLRPGGIQIARSDDIYIAPIEAESLWQTRVGFWAENVLGLDMSAAQRVAASSFVQTEAEAEHLLTAPIHLVHWDFHVVESPHVEVATTQPVLRDGTIHGFALWFTTQLDDEISLSNGPGLPRLAYGRPMLPLQVPLPVRKGEELELELRARLVGDDYVLSWRGGVAGDASRTFNHTSLDGEDLAVEQLHRLRLDATPQRSSGGDRLHDVLNLCDGGHSLGQIAATLAQRWGEPEDVALRFVSDVILRHGA